jgi:hypothetical protein
MNRSPSFLSSRPPVCKIESGGQKANRYDRRDETLAAIMPVEGKTCINDPKYRKAKPDSCGAHLEENSTTRTRSAQALRPDL